MNLGIRFDVEDIATDYSAFPYWFWLPAGFDHWIAHRAMRVVLWTSRPFIGEPRPGALPFVNNEPFRGDPLKPGDLVTVRLSEDAN